MVIQLSGHQREATQADRRLLLLLLARQVEADRGQAPAPGGLFRHWAARAAPGRKHQTQPLVVAVVAPGRFAGMEGQAETAALMAQVVVAVAASAVAMVALARLLVVAAGRHFLMGPLRL